MRKLVSVVWIFVVILFLMKFPAAFSSSSIWATGRVSTDVSQNRWDTTLYDYFNFTVWDSANGTLRMGQNILTLVPVSLNISVVKANAYNFSGSMVTVQTGEIPVGAFVVDSVNVRTPVPNWISMVHYGITVFGGITGAIAHALAQLVFIGSGYMISEGIITVILCVLFLYFLMKHFKALGLLLVVIISVLLMSGFANLIRLVWG